MKRLYNVCVCVFASKILFIYICMYVLDLNTDEFVGDISVSLILIGLKTNPMRGGMTRFIFQQCIQDYNSDACVLTFVLVVGFL